MTKLPEPVRRRRTFAIISHPDAGKTTLTEKLLLFGGAIQLAGAVKARGAQRRARSDWMNIERQRGISVTVSVMTFEHGGCTFNLLDTPGHEDFSEDTYRTLSAVDSAIMVLDAAKGIEAQTRKLFEVCRLRDVPIITFINKLDRESREPFELLDEISSTLALDVAPASWPIGMGQSFLGCYDLRADRLMLMDRADRAVASQGETAHGLDDPRLDELVPARAAAHLRDEVAMARELCPAFDLKSYREGHLTPVFFGSALHNFGVRELMTGLEELAPPPRSQRAADRVIDPGEPKVTGFVFKIQANMDPRHRDRVAFVRLCSGHFKRGMRLTISRNGKSLAVGNAVLFQARDRELAEEAFAGDIVGIPNHGVLHIGDTLTEGELLRFPGVPRFAPELLQRVRPDDPMRAKHLGRALCELAEEGAAQALRRRMGSEWVVGVVGRLQFDVLADRIRTEYGLPVHFESVPYVTARWAVAADHRVLESFCDAHEQHIADDHTGAPVFLARNDWQLEHACDDFPGVRLLDVVQPHEALADAAPLASLQ
jgi:peptide chain release factor 3